MKSITVVAIAALIQTGPVMAQNKRGRSASDAAKSFSLNLNEVPADTSVTAPTDVAPPAAPADTGVTTPHEADGLASPVAETSAPPKSSIGKAAGTTAALFTLDTPIIRLIGDPRSRAVLDNDMPGLSDDSNLVRFRDLSLRKFQPLTGGQLTDELLARVERDLAAIRPMPVGKGRNSSR